MFKLIVAGGRDFDNYDLLRQKLDRLLENKQDEGVCIISGRARGADSLGEKYALERGYCVEYYPADWDNLGKRAGIIRNMQMADNADGLVAFWDGVSKGTSHMIDYAKKVGLVVRVVRY